MYGTIMNKLRKPPPSEAASGAAKKPNGPSRTMLIAEEEFVKTTVTIREREWTVTRDSVTGRVVAIKVPEEIPNKYTLKETEYWRSRALIAEQVLARDRQLQSQYSRLARWKATFARADERAALLRSIDSKLKHIMVRSALVYPYCVILSHSSCPRLLQSCRSLLTWHIGS